MLKTKNCTVGTLLQRYNCGRLVELKNPFAKVSLAACLCICVHTCVHPFQKVTLCYMWHPFAKVAPFFKGCILPRWDPFSKVAFGKVAPLCKGGTIFSKVAFCQGGTLFQRWNPFFQRLHFKRWYPFAKVSSAK